MIGWLKGKVDNMVGGIVEGVKKVLGINSPSKVFANIGENMSKGIGEGFTNAMKDVENQMNHTIPTSLNIDTDLGTSDFPKATGTQNYFNIANMTVRKDSDIKNIARELYLLQRRNERGAALT
jgi:hypothetical protein